MCRKALILCETYNKNLKMKPIYWLTAMMALWMVQACKKEQLATFEVPSSYRYNSPHLDSKQVFAIGPSGNIRSLADTIGSFNRPNQEISDSINFYIQREYLTESLRKISFEANNSAVLEFARLDTTGGKEKFVDSRLVTTQFSLNGNDVVLNAYPDYRIVINNSFLELHFCQEYTFRSFRQDTSHIRRYFKQRCSDNTRNANDVVRRIINEQPGAKYDTISVEFVSYIFSKY